MLGGGAEQTVVTGIQYQPFGPVANFTYGNGLTHSYSVDNDYRITNIQVGGILSRGYSYDNADNITQIADGINSTRTQDFTYDNLDRLTSAIGVYGVQAYSYDDVGNRTGFLWDTGSGINTETYTYEPNSNRLTNITKNLTGGINGTRSFTYDDAGNPVQRTGDDGKTQGFVFNNANRAESVTVDGNLAATYRYNALGQRSIKTYANGAKELYFYDEAGQLIAVTNASGTPLREYIYLQNQLVGYVNSSTLHFVHNDHHNTPQFVTNSAQTVVWSADYEPFGKIRPGLFNSLSLDTRFPGQYLDPETGLYYNYFRDYDPSIGRYIESDPIGLNGGINTYAYVEGNPIAYIDSNGLLTWKAIKETAKEGVSDLRDGMGVRDLLLGYGYSKFASWIAGQLRPDDPHTNSPQDALRHCIWSCLLGPNRKVIASNHEIRGTRNGQPDSERKMDEHNNAQGFDKYCSGNPDNSKKGCVQWCLERLNDGYLRDHL